MSELPRVKVVNPGDGWLGTEYYINDQKIERVKAVDFRVAVDEVPTFTFETMGLPDIDMSGDVRFSFTPETVEEAKKVIEHEARKHRVDIGLHSSCAVPYIDGERVPCCERIDSNNETDGDSMKFIPDEEVLFSGLIQTDLSAYTRFAMIVLRNELLKHGTLYAGFWKSIESAVKENTKLYGDGYNEIMLNGISEFDFAGKILDRIIGEES